jgi:hypothetical protein
VGKSINHAKALLEGELLFVFVKVIETIKLFTTMFGILKAENAAT